MLRLLACLTTFLSLFVACQSSPTANGPWQVSMPGVVSLSSPRVADLNADGVADIVLGAGAKEWTPSDTGIVALDGRNGALLWRRPTRNQVFGSATFIDINRDETPDVVIGGRSAELQAIDGRTGELLWEFFKTDDVMGHKRAGWYNFSNAQPLPDLNADGVADLLLANGGDATVADMTSPRPVGRLLVLSGKDGKVLHQARVPDGRETYFSPILLRSGQPAPTWTLLFGTGGEAHGGHLFRTTLGMLLRNDLSTATPLLDERYKGLVAPPVVCHLNADGIPDYVINTVSGRTVALDGRTNQPLWTYQQPGSETFSSPAPGYFVGNDRIPDFFVTYAVGVYPYYNDAFQCLLDGRTGKLVRQLRAGSFSYASPLTADLDNDGADDVLYSINVDRQVGKALRSFSRLWAYSPRKDRTWALTDSLPGANFAVTPWLGDLDRNGRLDVVYAVGAAITKDFPGRTSFETAPLSLTIVRKEFPAVPVRAVRWGEYMGPGADGIFRPLRRNITP